MDSWVSGLSLPLSAAFLYVCYGVLILKALRAPQAKASNALRYGVILAMILHAGAAVLPILGRETPLFGAGICLSLLFLAATFVVVAESYIHRVTVLMGVTALCAAVATLMPLAFTGAPLPAMTFTLRCHIVVAIFAYGFIAIAMIQAVLLMLMQKRLKKPTKEAMDASWVATMPSLTAMERILFRIVACAFFCITIVVILGALASHDLHGAWLTFDHKTLVTLISWAVFAVLFFGRHVFGWKNAFAVKLFWLGAAAIVVAYLVYRFIQEVMSSGALS